MKTSINIVGEDQRHRAIEIIASLPLMPIHEVIVRERKSTRSLDQNARMWATLTDVSEQVVWHGQKLTKEEWKDVFTAALKRLKVVPGLDGGFVVIGAHTSKMTVAEMSEMIECAVVFGTQQGVKWTDYREGN
jgi:hypothetical protein